MSGGEEKESWLEAGGGPSWRFRSGKGVTGGEEHETWRDPGGGSGGTGGGSATAAAGMEAAGISWDRELAKTLARDGPAAPGWPSRWRPGMPGSRAALGLWERAGGLDEDEEEAGAVTVAANEAEVSPRQNVDTAQEVSEGEGGGLAGCWRRFAPADGLDACRLCRFGVREGRFSRFFCVREASWSVGQPAVVDDGDCCVLFFLGSRGPETARLNARVF